LRISIGRPNRYRVKVELDVYADRRRTVREDRFLISNQEILQVSKVDSLAGSQQLLTSRREIVKSKGFSRHSPPMGDTKIRVTRGVT
jgi:hypothetical protein